MSAPAWDTELIAAAWVDRSGFVNGVPAGTPPKTAKVIRALLDGPAGTDALVRGGLPVAMHARVMEAVQRGPKPRPVPAADAFELRSGSYATAAHIMRDVSMRGALLAEGPLEFNEMALTPTIARRPVTSEELSRLREQLERLHKVKLSNMDLEQALLQVAHERPYHPVRSYLESCTWDGTERLADLVERIGAEPSPLNIAMLRKWFVSAVARAMRPGCKVDTVLILVGPQGAGKSTLFHVLGGPWSCDTTISPGDKDSLLALHASWIYEWPELESYQRARSANTVKAFISSREDLFRPPYARVTGRFARSCVIVGTTNDDQFLSDPTGGRRYWTIKVGGRVDLAGIRFDRDQLWAEAVHAFTAGEPWYLSQEEESVLRVVQREHEVEDTWEARILSFAASQPAGVTTAEILEVLGKPIALQQRADTMRVASVLARAGYMRRRGSRDGERPWLYSRPTSAGGGA